MALADLIRQTAVNDGGSSSGGNTTGATPTPRRQGGLGNLLAEQADNLPEAEVDDLPEAEVEVLPEDYNNGDNSGWFYQQPTDQNTDSGYDSGWYSQEPSEPQSYTSSEEDYYNWYEQPTRQTETRKETPTQVEPIIENTESSVENIIEQENENARQQISRANSMLQASAAEDNNNLTRLPIMGRSQQDLDSLQSAAQATVEQLNRDNGTRLRANVPETTGLYNWNWRNGPSLMDNIINSGVTPAYAESNPSAAQVAPNLTSERLRPNSDNRVSVPALAIGSLIANNDAELLHVDNVIDYMNENNLPPTWLTTSEGRSFIEGSLREAGRRTGTTDLQGRDASGYSFQNNYRVGTPGEQRYDARYARTTPNLASESFVAPDVMDNAINYMRRDLGITGLSPQEERSYARQLIRDGAVPEPVTPVNWRGSLDSLVNGISGIAQEQDRAITNADDVILNGIAGLVNASESDGWLTQQASDLYGALPRIDPETPGAVEREEQRRQNMLNLARQIATDDEVRDERPPITGREIKAALNNSQNEARKVTDDLIQFAGNTVEPIRESVEDWAKSGSGDNTAYELAAESARNAGLYPGTAAYENHVNQYVNDYNARQQAIQQRQQSYLQRAPEKAEQLYWQGLPRDPQEAFYKTSHGDVNIALRDLNREWTSADRDQYSDYVLEMTNQGFDPRVASNVANYAVRLGENLPDTIGIIAQQHPSWTQQDLDNYLYGRETTPSTNKGVNSRLGNVVYGVPGYNADGTPNETMQAILNGEFTIDLNAEGLTPGSPAYEVGRQGNASRILHQFDVVGDRDGFTGITVPASVKKFMASSQYTAQGAGRTYTLDESLNIVDTSNPKNVETVDATAEEMVKAVDDLIAANKSLQDMISAGLITRDDVMYHFFKGINPVKETESKSSYRSYGGGGSSRKSYSSSSGSRSYGGYSGGGSNYGYATSQATKDQKQTRINNIMKNWTF